MFIKNHQNDLQKIVTFTEFVNYFLINTFLSKATDEILLRSSGKLYNFRSDLLFWYFL